MRILLVHPLNTGDMLTRVAREVPYFDAAAFFAPHALAAVAALTPVEHDVVLHDENVRGPVEPLLAEGSFDLIGVTLMTNQVSRARQILETSLLQCPSARRIVGGVAAGTLLQRLGPAVDTVFWGEIEDSWGQFLLDMAEGRPAAVYQRHDRPDMTRTPLPRWDLIADDLPRYAAASVQTARGCPFDCSFCDVIYSYGRRLRQKGIEAVLEEVRTLERLGVRTVMFADDSFAADRTYVKDLLRRLGPINNAFRFPLAFVTQCDVSIAGDDELLELLADANFLEVQLGIESTSQAALIQMNKRQNLRLDIVESVRKIQSYGILVMAHLIVGSDSDDMSAFVRTREFLGKAAILHHHCHPLSAPPGTRMWYDLKRQGRIVALGDDMRDRLDVTTNIIPMGMSRPELLEGLADYWEAVHEPHDFTVRARDFLEGVRRVPRVKDTGFQGVWRNRKVILGAMLHHAFRASPRHRKAFFSLWKSTRRLHPSMMYRMMYAHTGFVMDGLRARYSAEMARAQAARERANPASVQVLSSQIPLSEAVRSQMPAIARVAWDAIRPQVGDRETLIRLALGGLKDYHDRFGEELEEFNEVHAGHVRESCGRVVSEALGKGDLPGTPIAPGANDLGQSGLPEAMPSMLAGDLLNALDRTLRLAGCGRD